MAYLYQLEDVAVKPKPYSHLYYCYRKLYDDQTKSQLMLFENLHAQMMKAAWFYHDREIARAKLIWWYDEVKGSFNGSAQHPLTKKLSQSNLTASQKQLIIELTEHALAFIIYDSDITSENALVDALESYFSTFEKLKAQSIMPHLPEAIVQKMATITALAHYIYYLPELIKRELLIPKDDYLMNYQISQQQLKVYQRSDGFCQWLNALNKTIHTTYQRLTSDLTSDDKKKLKPLIINLKIWLKLVKETKKNNYDLFNTQIQLSPIQMLFCDVF
ncbi:hypothetical protein L3V82_01900 [Thiotrichales bacterium 19S3-7]|nr:hypothetical protein [Thiotrichales bacterium 19S3-7]MCF6800918.1 hypothetical protein [Thiotrichales bacterium 19S3-11]